MAPFGSPSGRRLAELLIPDGATLQLGIGAAFRRGAGALATICRTWAFTVGGNCPDGILTGDLDGRARSPADGQSRGRSWWPSSAGHSGCTTTLARWRQSNARSITAGDPCIERRSRAIGKPLKINPKPKEGPGWNLIDLKFLQWVVRPNVVFCEAPRSSHGGKPVIALAHDGESS